ncbi:MAG: CDP-glucose 4,6-dehydratase, partial [Holosporales bacterium]|nr:CDP-glucose 4,6-dehydratase [Holosporales bacterium]
LDPSFWKGKRVLVTGHTGFKGSWIVLCLYHLGARVVGLSLPPETTPNLYTAAEIESLCHSHFCDIREGAPFAQLIKDAQPEIVFHLAAQPLVRRSYFHPIETFSTNVMGTVHLLDSLRREEAVRVVVVVTTDKVYRNEGGFWAYRETDPLGGRDPYSASKVCCEEVVESYRRSFFEGRQAAVATARAGNVIGGGDWAEDRLLPDIMRAWQAGIALKVRHPEAVRPWQHVLEPLYGYLVLAEKLWDAPDFAGAYNFGPSPAQSATVHTVLSLVQEEGINVPLAPISEEERALPEARHLLLDPAKGKALLDIASILSLEEAVHRTLSWYKAYYDGRTQAQALCLSDIESLG